MNAQTAKFPMDGYADTCLGFGREAHGTSEELGTGATDSLCKACLLELNHDVKQYAQGPVAKGECKTCMGHIHGTKFYDCLCCYGD